MDREAIEGVLLIATVVGLLGLGFYRIALDVEEGKLRRAAWFADCIERGNDPTWCRESEAR